MATKPKIMKLTPEQRFWLKVDLRGPSECWEWNAARHGQGYGLFKAEPRRAMVRAHRFSWEMANGRQIPQGMCILHRCDNPPCVNPEHLQLGTELENIRDRDGKRRQSNMRKAHCAHGHSFSPENTRNEKGRRQCRTCARARQKRYSDNKKGLVA